MSITISVIKPPKEGSVLEFEIVTTSNHLTAKQIKAYTFRARRHAAYHVIPGMGRSVNNNKRARPEGHTLCKHEEDNGVFVGDKNGDYVCSICGLIEETEAFDHDDSDIDYPVDQLVYEPEPKVSTKKVQDIKAIEARLNKNITAWKGALETAPADEEEDMRRPHIPRGQPVPRADSVYEPHWQEIRRNYRLRRLLAYIKDGVTDTGDLRAVVGTATQTFYDDINRLIEDGRITSSKKGRRNTLAIVARA